MVEAGGEGPGPARVSRRRMLRASVGMAAAGIASACGGTREEPRGEEQARPAPFTVGEFRPIYDPGRGAKGRPWHVNDHCFVRGPDGRWHLFGIAWPDPGVTPVPRRGFLEHASARALTGPGWERHDPVLELRERLGETVMWAPHVVRRGGLFYLFIGPRPYDRPTRGRPNYRHPGYAGTDVFASPDPRHWSDGQKVGHVKAHAPELVEDADGSWYVSHCGVAQGGLYLAPFRWAEPG